MSAQVGVRVGSVGERAPRVDGMLTDWRGIRRTRVGEGRDASFEFALAHDESGVYFAASVSDDRVVRNDMTRTEDAIVLTFVVPQRRGNDIKQVWLFPGANGVAAKAALGQLSGRLRAISGARVVEAPTRGGYELEAFIPGRALGSRWAEGRLAVAMNDVDLESRPEVEASVATAVVDPRNPETLPRIVMDGGVDAPLQQFLRSQNMIGVDPSRTVRGDVSGDAQAEIVAQVGRFVVVYGPGYREGGAFDFVALPVQGAGGVRDFALRDFTGDGKKELAVTMRQTGEGGSREVWQLFSFDGTSVRPLFGIELRKETAQGSVEATMRIRGRRGVPTIEVSAGRARGLDGSNFREARASDAEGILLPWGPILARTYRWDGQRFAVTRERANPSPYVAATARTTQTAAAATPPPAPVTSAELLAAARRAEHVPRNVRARFSANVNLAENRTSEHLAVLGNAIFVVGPEFRGGNGYFHYEIPEAAGRLLDVSAADLTGDGRAEILIRAAQQLGDVTRELLIVHRFAGDGGFPRILMAEVARERDGSRIENEVLTANGRLEVRPGRARGWSADNWPWGASSDETTAPLLLPWSGRARVYRFTGGQLR